MRRRRRSAQRAIDRVLALLAGGRSISATFRSTSGGARLPSHVYEVARTIPPGQTMTYGEIAKKLGAPPNRARSASARPQPRRYHRALPSRAGRRR
jgi:O6-methylguanine-DNA--protein-cysteine methyltransferase